ncbi:phosphoenolpyruvate--protein phosphotransferase [Thiotrichales bacterium 19X7-9]|nr:phosphoenolpyruvate--protein phosphotransferase [Thiotrichales bacterium 19X7-9]
MQLWQQFVNALENNAALEDALRALASQIQTKLDIDACSIFLTEDDKNLYTLTATTLTPLLIGLVHIHADQDVVGNPALREEPVLIKDIFQNHHPTILTSFTRAKLHTLLSMPIIYKSDVIGIIAVQNKNINDMPEHVQTKLVTLCANIAEALDEALDRDDVTEKIEEATKDNPTVFFDGQQITKGAAIGTAVVRYNIFDLDSIPDKQTQSDNEVDQFKLAVNALKQEIDSMITTLDQQVSETETALFKAYLQILDSTSFYDAVINLIEDGIWVQSALKQVVRRLSNSFSQMSNEYLQSRASDIQDIGRRILTHLQKTNPLQEGYPSDTILVAYEITPSMLAEVPKGFLKAVISQEGTENSHTAILARAMGVPFIIGFPSLPISFLEHKHLVVDAHIGRVYANPSKGLVKAYQRLIEQEEQLQERLQSIRLLPSETADHHKVQLQANVGLVADLDVAIFNGSEGIGLYRSEVPFMIRDNFPSEDEQRIIYSQFLDAFPSHVVTMRTLDVGADKALPYFSEPEANPALGWRGLRMLLDQTDLFLMQVRAMLKASKNHGNLKILLPMVSELEEVEEATSLIKRAWHELIEEGFSIKFPQIGIMIEVPSVIYQLPAMFKYIDFISVGSNDLTQYLLAADRNNSKVSYLYSQLHPAVIRAIYDISSITVSSAKIACLCGELAGNPLAIPLLVGMGFHRLSMNAVDILRAKWILRHITYEQCVDVTKKVLRLNTKEEVRRFLEDFLIKENLANLIKTGHGKIN